MATKKEIKALEDSISVFQEQLQNADNEIIRLSKHNAELILQVEQINNLNKHLAKERDRLFRSETMNRNLNIDLMHAIAVLGHRESNRIRYEVWHECNPQVQNYVAVTDDSQTL